jgi:hypothetical protein
MEILVLEMAFGKARRRAFVEDSRSGVFRSWGTGGVGSSAGEGKKEKKKERRDSPVRQSNNFSP